MMLREFRDENASGALQAQPSYQLLHEELAGVVVLLDAALTEIGLLIQGSARASANDKLGRCLASMRLKVECARFNVDRVKSISNWASRDV